MHTAANIVLLPNLFFQSMLQDVASTQETSLTFMYFAKQKMSLVGLINLLAHFEIIVNLNVNLTSF